ncbi:alpha/beta fold hydrolase [Varunaivibrio sulfuroxidans]|uniref:alpha/beta fold hydrolase n=1 Tax=Varunaivibrio sulfuroxidans TaxID=1773489 RepID=UPI001FB2389A|nr:alpha/beta hydrolase [Varunaivibrio sulfuroxidans]WES31312.1 alpha/beta hydrolase [Varunaivibrio sulfuroxidans]
MAYVLWPGFNVSGCCVCVHGLTRNARDFDILAQALGADYAAVACPDIVGRGCSDRLERPEDYGYPQYMADMAALIARLGVERVDWVGTSMGGLIGMMLAAQPGSPIRRLVLNDIGAVIPGKALERLAEYVGKAPFFESMQEVETYLRRVHGSFGTLDDAQWAHLARHSARRGDDGRWTLNYDPAIAQGFVRNGEGRFDDVDLWALWDRVRCPTLILRGERSDILSADCAREMVARNACAQWVEIPNTGHAPALMAAEQIATVRAWLKK